jgi:protein TonB
VVPSEKAQSEKVPFCGGIDNPPCTTPPRVTYSTGPNYPKQGRARLPGTVQLALVVGSDGLPREITVFRSLAPDFDEEAINSVKQWKFQPATLDGKSVATKIHVDVTFNALPSRF